MDVEPAAEPHGVRRQAGQDHQAAMRRRAVLGQGGAAVCKRGRGASLAVGGQHRADCLDGQALAVGPKDEVVERRRAHLRSQTAEAPQRAGPQQHREIVGLGHREAGLEVQSRERAAEHDVVAVEQGHVGPLRRRRQELGCEVGREEGLLRSYGH